MGRQRTSRLAVSQPATSWILLAKFAMTPTVAAAATSLKVFQLTIFRQPFSKISHSLSPLASNKKYGCKVFSSCIARIEDFHSSLSTFNGLLKNDHNRRKENVDRTLTTHSLLWLGDLIECVRCELG